MSKLKVGDLNLSRDAQVGGTTLISKKELDQAEGVCKIEETYLEEKVNSENSEVVKKPDSISASEEKSLHGTFDENPPMKPPYKERTYSFEELEEVVKSIAGSFYGSFIHGYHPEQLRKGAAGIRATAVDEVIEFSKLLLKELKKEK